ncbi:MAG TPA: nucleotidyl transferase AbiEii/AbiGii toxin family protein [Xanthobacteraceae bacterium]|jgi:predicted nucleotidyltransferase component of viral defense system|nr:nucleotidyl transferase AbiEii/AbiGii toxin family protein [Xanthobacteraceae bacterium]
MPFNDIYRRQVALLIRVLPIVAEEKCFALKGGTAINLFIRDMPRLSVDIDLTYLPIESYEKSLAAIDAAMGRIGAQVKKRVAGSTIAEGQQGSRTHLLVRTDGVTTKIDVTPVLRGSIHEPETKSVTEAVERTFGFAEMPLLPFTDLYAGKIVAGLDRQHPRDFFDTRELFANEGIDDGLRGAFIVYLESHNRPVHEVLTARRKDMTLDYNRGFVGMTDEPVSLKELIEEREILITEIVGGMPDKHKKFLIGFESGKPDWSLISLPDAVKLPAVKFRQQNLDKLSPEQRADLVQSLEKVLAQ